MFCSVRWSLRFFPREVIASSLLDGPSVDCAASTLSVCPPSFFCPLSSRLSSQKLSRKQGLPAAFFAACRKEPIFIAVLYTWLRRSGRMAHLCHTRSMHQPQSKLPGCPKSDAWAVVQFISSSSRAKQSATKPRTLRALPRTPHVWLADTMCRAPDV